MLVKSTVVNKWVEIRLNHPETRNAITGPMGVELAQAIRAADRSAESELILLHGAEGAFCSGLNLKEFNADPPPEWLGRFSEIWRGVHRALYECSKPVVVPLEKYAINGGAALALAADLLLVGDDSFLQVGEVRQGMAAPYNVAWLRLRHSETVSAQLTLTGRRFTGVELKKMGIAFDAPPTRDVLKVARELAEELTEYPSGALAQIKNTMRRFNTTSADNWFDRATIRTE